MSLVCPGKEIKIGDQAQGFPGLLQHDSTQAHQRDCWDENLWRICVWTTWRGGVSQCTTKARAINIYQHIVLVYFGKSVGKERMHRGFLSC